MSSNLPEVSGCADLDNWGKSLLTNLSVDSLDSVTSKISIIRESYQSQIRFDHEKICQIYFIVCD